MKIRRFNNDWDFVYHGSGEGEKELGQIERVQYQNNKTGEGGPKNVLFHAHATVPGSLKGGKKEGIKKVGAFTSKEKAAAALKKFHQLAEGSQVRGKKPLSESSLLDRMNIELKGREHARRIKQLHRTIEHADSLSQKYHHIANLHDDIAEDPKHPRHRNPAHHEEKAYQHRKKSQMLSRYVDAFRDELDE
jgi:hypothetical protein